MNEEFCFFHENERVIVLGRPPKISEETGEDNREEFERLGKTGTS